MTNSERQLLEAAAKILRGKYALNEAQAPDDFEGEYDDEKSPSTLELISKRKGLRGKQEESTELEEAYKKGEKVKILLNPEDEHDTGEDNPDAKWGVGKIVQSWGHDEYDVKLLSDDSFAGHYKKGDIIPQIYGAQLRPLIESTELEEAVSSEVKNIMDSIPKLPESDMKDFLNGLYRVFDKKAQAEKDADKKEVYNKISSLFDSAWIAWLQASPDGL